nr:podocan-like protein 1 [Pelodiscus sinensis]|eukprot:XP_025035842.1 podocan-like protein 1 [Pelodiscus sinensis]
MEGRSPPLDRAGSHAGLPAAPGQTVSALLSAALQASRTKPSSPWSRCSTSTWPTTRSVYLHNNQLSNAGLPYNAFNGSDAVSTMILSSNQLSYLPQNLPPALVRLHLQNNRISRIPRGALSSQGKLRELYLQNNNLSNQGLDPSTFSKLKSLEYLDLSNNNLSEIPASFPPSIVILHLGKNHIGALPRDSLSRARGLQYLLLQNNHLTAAGVQPEAVIKPARLHTPLLRLPQNQINSLSPELLANLTGLKELHLAHNRLRVGSITPGTWQELQGLKLLDLSHNELSYVPPDLPESLEYLYLQHNRIAVIEAGAFRTVPDIRAIILRSNRLLQASVSPAAFAALEQLEVVDTTGNPEPISVPMPRARQWLRAPPGASLDGGGPTPGSFPSAAPR